MPSWRANESRDAISFSCGKVLLVWKKTDDKLRFEGFHLRSGSSSKRAVGFTTGEASPLWEADIRDKLGYSIHLDGTEKEAFSYKIGRTLILKWAGLSNGLFDVILRVRRIEKSSLTKWRFELRNRSRKHTVWSVTFPSFTDVLGPTRSHRNDRLITTEGFGCEVPDPVRQKQHAAWPQWRYPNAIQSMSYLGLTNGGSGFYLGTQDPEGGRQDFDYLPHPEQDLLPMRIHIPVENAGRAQSRVTLQYDTVMGVFEGDWYDAAQIHRSWARKQQWASRTISRRDDIPAWARRIPLWIRMDINEDGGPQPVGRDRIDEYAANAIQFRNKLGFDIGCHAYQWHEHPFDLMYPDYTPRAYMSGLVKKLQSNGIHVMPYINGRLFDVDNRDWFTENARKYTAKEGGAKLNPASERVVFETYQSGSPMAVMCSWTPYWHKKIAGVVERLVRDLGIDAIYIDQISAAWSELCSDRKHGHPLRGGGWWTRGYAKMLQEINRRLRKLGREVLVTSEANADTYAGMLGGMLMVNSLRNHIVPAFPAVYGGRANLFGRSSSFGVSLKQRLEFRVVAAQNILWGCQTGWFANEDTRLLTTDAYSGELAFLGRLCRLYSQMRDFIQNGRMLRPPLVDGCVRKKVVWNVHGTWKEDIPTVWASSWRYRKRLITAIVNCHTGKQTVRVNIRTDITAKDSTTVWWAGEEEGDISLERDRFRIALPPLSVLKLTSKII